MYLNFSAARKFLKANQLRILLLKANHLGGQIPIQVCLLQKLNILDLSYNKFSGPIPHCLSNITFDASAPKASLRDFSIAVYFSCNLSLYLNTKSIIIDNLLDDISKFDGSLNVKEEVEFTTKTRTYSTRVRSSRTCLELTSHATT